MLQERLPSDPLPPSAGKAESVDDERGYDAFISYSREDQAFAQLLKRRLEAYRAPKGLDLPKRNLRVFLDTSDIRGADYDQTIERELGRSRSLIVLCSPAARASDYVADEIRRFIAARRAEGKEPQILPLLLDGIPNNEARSPDDEARTAFPDALYEAATMPLAQSFLGFDPKRNKLDRGAYRDAWFATLAELFDVERHGLEERDAKRAGRTRRITAAATLAILAVVSGLAVIAWVQRGQAIAQRDHALRQESRALATLARGEIEAGNAVNGMLLALRGMPIAAADEPRPLVSETRQALVDALLAKRELLVLPRSQAVTGYQGVNVVGFSRDGARILAGYDDGVVRVWDAIGGDRLLLRLAAPTIPLAFSSDGTRLVSGAEDGMCVVDVMSGDELLHFRGSGAVASAAFSSDGARIVSGSGPFTERSDEPNQVQLWDAISGDEILTLRGVSRLPITAVAISPGGTRIVASAEEGRAYGWDTATPAEDTFFGYETLHFPHDGDQAFIVAFSPDGTRIATGSGLRGVGAVALNEVRVWDAVSGARILVLRGHEDGVTDVGFSADGARIVSGSSDGTVRVWDAVSGAEQLVLRGHRGVVTTVAFASNGARIVSGDGNGTVRVWDAAVGDPEPQVLHGHQQFVSSVEFSPDGARIVSGSWDGTVRVWSVATRSQLLALGDSNMTLSVNAARFSPGGDRVVAGMGWFLERPMTDHLVRLWDADSGAEVLALSHGQGEVSSVGYSPDGGRLVISSASPLLEEELGDYVIRVWDVERGEAILALHGHEGDVLAAEYSPDGTRIASASEDGTVRLWDTSSGDEVLVLRANDGWTPYAVGFSPDGSRIAAASGDDAVRVWDADGGLELLRLSCQSFVYSPDGKRIVCSYFDEIRISDATSGENLTTLRHEGSLTTVGLSPDGARIVSGHEDGTVRIWPVGADDTALVAYACAQLPRDLSPDDIERFNLDPKADWPCAEDVRRLWPREVAEVEPAAGLEAE